MNRTIYGLPVYEDGEMPEGMAALVNSHGEWIGILERKVMTQEQFRNYMRKYSTSNSRKRHVL